MVDKISRREERRGWRTGYLWALVAAAVLTVVVVFGPPLFNTSEQSGMDQLAGNDGAGEIPKGAIGPATITTKSTDAYGSFLADSAGHPLYLFKKDTRGAEGTQAVSQCYDDCAKAWPPLLSSEQVQAQGEVNKDMLSLIERKDGAKQVAYNGWPLYRYAKDVGPEQVTGQDVEDFGEEWYLVTPGGEEVHADNRPS